MSVVSIETQYENQILQDYLINFNIVGYAPQEGGFWLSGVQSGSKFVWASTGKTFVYTNFNGGAASFGGYPAVRWFQLTGLWYSDEPPTATMGVICESLP